MEKYKNGEHYLGKGYYWKGKFITDNYGQDAFELGYYHGLLICENKNKKILKRIKKQFLKFKPINDYERGKKKAILEKLAEY